VAYNQKGFSAASKSLLAFTNCLSSLSTKNAFIPYRDSVLTRLLKESLGGSYSTVLLTTISPAEGTLEETVSCLKHPLKAMTVSNTIEVTERKAKVDPQNLADLKNNQKLKQEAKPKDPDQPEVTSNDIQPKPQPQTPEVDLMAILEQNIHTVNEREVKTLEFYLKQKQVMLEKKKWVFSEDYDGSEEDMQEYEVMSARVADLNTIIEECAKMRINIEDEIPKLDLHPLQKIYLQNLLSNAQSRVHGVWIAHDNRQLSSQIRRQVGELQEMKDQISLRDDILIKGKSLLKTNKVQAKISYDMLVRTENVPASLEEVDLDTSNLPKLIQNPTDASSIQYSMAPLKLLPNATTLTQPRKTSTEEKSPGVAKSKAQGGLGLLPEHSYNYLNSYPKLRVESAKLAGHSHSYSVDERELNPSFHSDHSIQVHHSYSQPQKDFPKYASPTKRFNMDYRQSPFLANFSKEKTDKLDRAMVRQYESAILQHHAEQDQALRKASLGPNS